LLADREDKVANAKTGQVSTTSGGLTLTAYPGDNMVLLAMSLTDDAVNDTDKNLAGFAVFSKSGTKPEQALPNRLSFTQKITKDTTPEQREWTPTDQAPFQKFRWVDVPSDGFDADITYRVVAKYFTGTGAEMKDGPSASVTVSPPQQAHSNFRVAFTRGYATSQAYVDKFGNKDIRPAQKSATFDTGPYQPQYAWLGGDAHKRLFDFIAEIDKDATAQISVFAYDLDEPDVIAAFCRWGKQKRLHAILDNASLHTKKGATEIDAAKMIKAAAGDDHVKQGDFARFQHNKVIIKRDASGKAQKVLFGSMNFSLRGLYIQANNVMIADDPTTADYFAQAFDTAWKVDVKAPGFAASPIAQKYNVISATGTPALPQAEVALSPHKSEDISLAPVSAAIQGAKSSVLFAVMAPTGGGSVLASLRIVAGSPVVFSYGTVETDTGLAVQSANGQMGAVTSFQMLKDKVPEPFKKEWNGGMGMHIHHKFIVVDFNGDNPVAFAGSSNLAGGGECANGDSLIQMHDPFIASMYAIEAVRLFDHYSFRKYMAKATAAKPLSLWYPSKPDAGPAWWKPYYDKTNIKLRDRYLFADLPLPGAIQSVKPVDWQSMIDEQAKAAGKKKSDAAAAKPAPSGGAKTKKAAKKKATKKKATKKKATKKKAAKKTAKKKVAKKATRKKAVKKKATKKKTAKKTVAKRKTASARKPAKKASAKRKPAKKKAKKTKKAKKRTTARR
jgi:PLD-like domain